MSRMPALFLLAALSSGVAIQPALAGNRPAEGNASPDAAKRPKQIVLVSFDGAADNALWEKSREIAARTGAHFTYFLSCTHLIDWSRKDSYKAPGYRAGRSNVGFAPTPENAAARLDQIWKAHQEGHEIANHACGHFDGKDWTKADWLQEFDSFDRILKEAWKDNGVSEKEPDGWADFVASGIKGFRAPYLSQSDALSAAQRATGMRYDASLVTPGPVPPRRKGNLVSFGLPLIPEGPRQRRIIAMDYNLFIRHSVGIETPARSAEFEQRSYNAFKAAFDAEYDGDRVPIQIGLHFVEMNGGAYWRAMERLVNEVCPRQDVACITYSQAVDGMEAMDDTTASGL